MTENDIRIISKEEYQNEELAEQKIWVENISKQLVDNKITVKDTPGYIERTFVGTTKLWIENLPSERITTLRSDKKNRWINNNI